MIGSAVRILVGFALACVACLLVGTAAGTFGWWRPVAVIAAWLLLIAGALIAAGPPPRKPRRMSREAFHEEVTEAFRGALPLRDVKVIPRGVRLDDAPLQPDGFDTTAILDCGCAERWNCSGVPELRQPRIGDWHACRLHSAVYGYDPAIAGEPLYDRDRRVVNVRHELVPSVEPPR